MEKVKEIDEDEGSYSRFYYRLNDLTDKIKVYNQIVRSDEPRTKSPPRINKLLPRPSETKP